MFTGVLDRARAVAGSHLLGLVAIGSWARGTASADSDIDVLVVVDANLPLTRDVYRRWDRDPPSLEGRLVDAHFIHLAPHDTPSAVWCEAATEGRVWYDPTGVVEATLVGLRRAIATGRVVRSSIHGQPYWKGVA